MYTEISRGSFISTGVNKYIALPTDLDWMNVYNMTTAAAGLANGTATSFYWQRGMAANDGLVTLYNAAGLVNSTNLTLATPGFTLYNSSNPTTLAPIGFTAISAAAVPVVTTADTTTVALVAGDIVRLVNTQVGGPAVNQFGGVDFTVGAVVANTSFELLYGPQIVAGVAMISQYRKLTYDTVWYPRKRTISKIALGATTTITFTVTHDFIVGMKVRVHVPSVRGSTAFGTTQLNNLIGTVTAVDHTAGNNSITLDIDSTGFTAFNWPLTAVANMFSLPTVVPVGENSNVFNDTVTDDKFINGAAFGIILGGGTVSSPAGMNADVIYWTAGKSNL